MLKISFFAIQLVVFEGEHGEFLASFVPVSRFFKDHHIFRFDCRGRSENSLYLRLRHSGSDLIVVTGCQFCSRNSGVIATHGD